MLNPPLTLEEAEQRRYGAWAYDGHGWPYRSNRCAYEVDPGRHYYYRRQCYRGPGHGPSNLYCRQHARIVEAGERCSWCGGTVVVDSGALDPNTGTGIVLCQYCLEIQAEEKE